ncbi:glycine zipper 2TM domain-containing protein [Paraherbaspirillum soli]|uniref:Glycine zipper 2TM domain-containing protein n=1 Tax=Paraherbaspirillum soli TaxID=631222 RepID=A0ABW0M317_9BURK
MKIRTTSHQAMLATLIGGSLLLGGCAAPYGGGGYGGGGYGGGYGSGQGYGNPPSTSAPPAYQQGYINDYGVIEAIDVLNTPPSAGIGGALVGGVLGGVVGHQVGKGSGNTLATIAGAVGGAVVGNQLEQRSSSGGPASYNIRIRMRNNSVQTINVSNPGDLRVGDRVRVDNGQISRY